MMSHVDSAREAFEKHRHDGEKAEPPFTDETDAQFGIEPGLTLSPKEKPKIRASSTPPRLRGTAAEL